MQSLIIQAFGLLAQFSSYFFVCCLLFVGGTGELPVARANCLWHGRIACGLLLIYNYWILAAILIIVR